MVINEKAECVDVATNNIILRSEKNKFQLTKFIRLKYDVKRTHSIKLKLSRKKILIRDNFKCGYCGTSQNLTVDHIIPISRNGPHTFDNLITACVYCNRKKSDKTPNEANMPLIFKPFTPTVYTLYTRKFKDMGVFDLLFNQQTEEKDTLINV
jgi:5-methylcytosine-specific restriction endonuclease McrA